MTFDCTKCGACCVEAGPVPVWPTDPTPRWRTKTPSGMINGTPYDSIVDERWMDRHLGGRCKALSGQIGHECKCVCYDRRPYVCADFDPGSEGCLASLKVMMHKLANPEHGYRGYGADWKSTV